MVMFLSESHKGTQTWKSLVRGLCSLVCVCTMADFLCGSNVGKLLDSFLRSLLHSVKVTYEDFGAASEKEAHLHASFNLSDT